MNDITILHDQTTFPAKEKDIGTLVLQIALFLTCLCISAPLMPTTPPTGFDSCWGFGMDYAREHGFIFGRDLIYTYGPYADIATGVFNPAHPFMGLVLGLALGAATWFGLFALARPMRRRWGWALLLVLAAFGPLQPLLMPFLFCLLAAKILFGKADRLDSLAMALLLPALSLSCFIKLCDVTWNLTAIALVVAASLWQRKWLRAAGIAGAMLIGLPFFWLLAGQPLTALPDLFQGAWQISYGYNQAMHSLGDSKEVALLLLAGGCSLFWIGKRAELSTPHRIFLLLVFAVFWFFAFKSSVVRHDAHAVFGGHFALLSPLLLGLCLTGTKAFSRRIPSRGPICATIFGLLLCIFIDFHYGRFLPTDIFRTYSSSVQGISLRLEGNEALMKRRTAALKRIAATDPLPFIQGRVDLYPSDMSLVAAEGMCWSPRPIFQSHEVSTPTLADINRRHLLGPKAPETIFFNVQAIDRRYPNLEDGASWPVLLARYAPTGFAGAYAILRRRPAAAFPDTPQPLSTTTGRLNEPIFIPQTREPVFVHIDMRPTVLGWLTNLAYKYNRLKFAVVLEDGSRRTYRIIPLMAQAGFVISPLVKNGRAFASLYAGRPDPTAPRIRSMTILAASGFGWQWRDTFTVRFSTIPISSAQRNDR